MPYPSRLLAWVRTFLFGPHTPDTHTRAAPTTPAPKVCPSGASPRTSPQMWADILAEARHRRAPWLWPPAAPPAFAAHMDPGGLVRTYVFHPDAHQPTEPDRQFAEVLR